MNHTHTSYQGTKPDWEKSPELLQHEVDAARERLGARLDTLSHRLSPGELLDQALAVAKEHGGEFSHNLGSQVKQNPLPVLLTSIGLSWMMMGTRSPQPYGQGYSVGSHSSMGDKASSAMDTARGAMASASGRAHDLKERAGEVGHSLHEGAGNLQARAGDAMESARWRARSAQQQLEAFCRDQPVLAGSIGVALGALLGSMLPHSRQEDELMGEYSEQARSRARAAGAEQYEKVREKGGELAESAKEKMHQAASRQGTPGQSPASGTVAPGDGSAGSPQAAGGTGTASPQQASTPGSSAGDYNVRGAGKSSERKDERGSHPSRF